MKHKNTSYVLNLLIEKLAIPVTRNSIEEEIAMHPNSHSLLAISDVLSNWNIPNASFQLPFDELVHVPVPFIAYSNKEFVIIERLDERQVTISNEHFNSCIISIAEFKKSYNGTILAAEKEELSGEINYAGKRRKEIIDRFRSPFVVTGAIAVFLVILLINPSYTNTFQWPIVFLMMLKTVGLFISILLLIQSIDSNNPLIGKKCNSENCNAILSSEAAKISAEFKLVRGRFFLFCRYLVIYTV